MDAVGVAGEVINVATGVRTSLNQAWTTLGDILGPLPQPIYQPSRVGDVRHSLADIGKAENLLGYRPEVDFDEGLRRTVEWAQTAT
jgi:nucleoside-diphosphate-sugar epimerase